MSLCCSMFQNFLGNDSCFHFFLLKFCARHTLVDILLADRDVHPLYSNHSIHSAMTPPWAMHVFAEIQFSYFSAINESWWETKKSK